MSVVLSGTQLLKRYADTVALDHVDIDLRCGEVLGLIGQNGSGKSTLLKALAGMQPLDGGQLNNRRGEPIQLRSPIHAARLGIGMVHQEQSLIPNLTVAENIFLDKPNAAKRRGWLHWRNLLNAARVQLEKVELDIAPDVLIEDLTFAERQMVELAKVLAIEELVDEPLVILFDEPTSVLAPEEIALLFRQIRRLRSRTSAVFVSHRLDEVLEISDRVIVMTNGRRVAERSTAATDPDELFRLMVGVERVTPPARTAQPSGTPIRLEARNMTVGTAVHDVSFELKTGDILGLVGVQGSGAEELCRAIFGAAESVQGECLLDGHAYLARSPADAIRQGVGYVPAERKREGMLASRTLYENMVLTFGLHYGHFGLFIDRRRERQVVAHWLERLKVKADSAQQRIDALSGGNQQKVVLGKWLLSAHLKLLLLDHPSRGLDPGARGDLFNAIRDSARQDVSVVFVGDTIEEVLELSDHVMVMKDGRITQRFDLRSGRLPLAEELVRHMV